MSRVVERVRFDPHGHRDRCAHGERSPLQFRFSPPRLPVWRIGSLAGLQRSNRPATRDGSKSSARLSAMRRRCTEPAARPTIRMDLCPRPLSFSVCGLLTVEFAACQDFCSSQHFTHGDEVRLGRGECSAVQWCSGREQWQTKKKQTDDLFGFSFAFPLFPTSCG